MVCRSFNWQERRKGGGKKKRGDKPSNQASTWPEFHMYQYRFVVSVKPLAARSIAQQTSISHWNIDQSDGSAQTQGIF